MTVCYVVPVAVAVMSSGRSSIQRALVLPRIDAWLTGWLAVVAWIGIEWARRTDTALPVGGWLTWTAAFVGAAHFAMSYRLAYDGGRSSFGRHPIALAIFPVTAAIVLVGAIAASGAGADWGTQVVRSGANFVLLLTMWHYIKQVYGVIRLGAGFSGFRLTKTEALGLRFALYPLWFAAAGDYLAGRQLIEIDTFDLRADFIAGGLGLFERAMVALAIVSLVGFLGAASWRLRKLPPSTVVAPLVAAVLWVGFLPNMYMAIVMLPAFHALQYLACCYRAQWGLLDEVDEQSGRETSSRHQLWQVTQIVVAAGCAGLFATAMLPDILDGSFGVAAEPGLWLTAVFVFLNLHHYLIDATVWRSDGRLVTTVREHAWTSSGSST